MSRVSVGLRLTYVVVVLLLVNVLKSAECSYGDTPCSAYCDNGDPVEFCQGQNEKFQCCGPCTEPTCAVREPKQNCQKACVSGCFCENGYIRNAHGVCVKMSEC
uniref:TIL domain-containing protein n=1 Tax=Anopheles albimanus TaxID=7167 RepID=A0A182FPA1_ANOAL